MVVIKELLFLILILIWGEKGTGLVLGGDLNQRIQWSQLLTRL